MPDIEAAKTTIHALNGKLIKGRNIEVNFASPRRSRQNKGRRTSESAPQHPEPPTVISVATAEDEPTIPKRDKASCHMSDGKRIAMSQILHLKANPHDICKICAPPVYGKVTTNRSLSQKNSGLSLYSRRALVASNHIYMESKKSPVTLAEVDTSTPIISEPDYDVAPLCYQNLCSSTRFRFDSKSTDSDLYDSSSSFRALQQDVSNAMQQCEPTHPFPLDDPGRDYPISMKSTVTSDYSDRKIERELYSLFSPENRELSQAYEAFTDWAMR
ncbi:uncharacterized protein LOC111265220 isoform X2 [Varroa jacobsoni]|nr:uncharacterized protein LOC111265220 isoform X2 [Varroa jacobsoni]